MDYKKIYGDFIKDRREKEETLTGYSEKHHIIPRARGGDDSFENIIKLSALDHIRAHLLLAKIYGGSMWYAIMIIVKRASKARRIPTKLQILLAAKVRANIPPPSEETRRKLSLAKKGGIHSEETKQKISLVHKGKKVSEETKQKISLAKKGVKKSEETRRKLSLAHAGRVYKKTSEETKQKISLALKGKIGRTHSEESKRKISLSLMKPIKCNTTNQVFESREVAAEHFKISKSAIQRSIKNGTTSKRSGLSFSYV